MWQSSTYVFFFFVNSCLNFSILTFEAEASSKTLKEEDSQFLKLIHFPYSELIVPSLNALINENLMKVLTK